MSNSLRYIALLPLVTALIACGGDSTDPIEDLQEDVEVSLPFDDTPAQLTPAVDQDVLSAVLGLWYCASTWLEGTEYRAGWEEPWEMTFNSDMTVNITGSTGTFWQSGDALVIQTEDGRTSEFGFNVDGRGGIASDNTHCLRELPEL